MTVLTAIQNASMVFGIDKPTAIFTSDLREHQELQSLVNQCAEYIAQEHDWTALKALDEVTGDGVSPSFPLNGDYGRMLFDGQIRSNKRPDKPLTHIVDHDTWLSDLYNPTKPDNPQWTTFGKVLHVFPVLPNLEVLRFYYIKAIPEFTADADVFLLDERLLTLCMKWQWKANKGLEYAEDMSNYQIRLQQLKDIDRGPHPFLSGLDRYRVNSDYVSLKEFTP